MKSEDMNVVKVQNEKPRYEEPELTVMSQEELLATFQVTQAGTTWWVM